MQNAIEVKNLKVVFPDRGRMIRAVEGVDLTVKKGECLALVGESGCGKSMTLRCIAGIVKPDRGRIVLDGRVLRCGWISCVSAGKMSQTTQTVRCRHCAAVRFP